MQNITTFLLCSRSFLPALFFRYHWNLIYINRVKRNMPFKMLWQYFAICFSIFVNKKMQNILRIFENLTTFLLCSRSFLPALLLQKRKLIFWQLDLWKPPPGFMVRKIYQNYYYLEKHRNTHTQRHTHTDITWFMKTTARIYGPQNLPHLLLSGYKTTSTTSVITWIWNKISASQYDIINFHCSIFQ